MKKFIAVAAAMLALAGGIGAATLATTSTIPVTITVPYTVGDQTGKVVVTKNIDVPVETVTETVTVTTPPTTITEPPPTTTTAPQPPTTTDLPPSSQQTISVAQFNARAVAGAVIDNVHVTGSVRLGAANVTVSNSAIDGTIDIDPDAPGAKVLNSTLRQFNIWGASNVVIDGNTIDGRGRVANNQMWDVAGQVPSNIRITNNKIQNFYVGSTGTHSEGLYIGYSKDVLIEGNTFTNNGNTGHIFFTWFGSTANPSTSYPRNVCVKGNQFGPTHGAYVDVNFRAEIPTSANIKVQPDASSTSPQFAGSC